MRSHCRILMGFALLAAVSASPSSAGLLAHYSFDADASDVSGHSAAGTVSGATFTASGYSGGAYVFDGIDDNIDIALDINPDVLPRLTMGAWVKASATDGIRHVISSDNAGFDRSLCIDFRSGIAGGWTAFAGAGVPPTESAVADAWTFVAVSFDQAAGSVSIYVNDREYAFASGFSTGAAHPFVRIGMNPSFGEFFAGCIDEVFFYDTVLTAGQIADVRLNGVSANPTAIPEPASFAALAGLATLGLVAGRRRRS